MDHVHASPDPSHMKSDASHGATPPFTEAELEALHKQDIAAGRAVVVLMCSIFLLGVFIYTIVAASVAF